MTTKQELQKKVDDRCAKAAIDILQARNYFSKSQYEGYEDNLKTVATDLLSLVEETAEKID